ncbi:frizzled-1 [Octopus bimaculoides]|uniref:frizzled-1 n=1 Tax=Octopus bimaculoides TaxID=37653 RepID=UPI00071C5590|nr:frizzled-1 [Octopus bimaculoides]
MVKIAMTGTHLLRVRPQQRTSCLLSIREALLLLVLLLLSINKVIVLVDAADSSEDAAGGGGGGGLGGKEMIKPYSLDTSMTEDWAGLRMQRHRCVDIPSNLTLCQNVGYKQMRLPNFFAHDNIPEVGQQSAIWISLIGRKCHPDTKLFLCSLFTPICLEQVINPCNSLCTAVKQSCESIMVQWGYPWPKILGCDQFPLDHDLCIHPQHTIPDFESLCCSRATFEAFLVLVVLDLAYSDGGQNHTASFVLLSCLLGQKAR